MTFTGVNYHLKGTILGACNCEWGCPCNFEAPPSNGNCEGGYVWHFEQSEFDGVNLDRLSVALFSSSPSAVHEGNMTSIVFIDEKADQNQREVLESLTGPDSEVAPWGIFMSLTTKFLGFYYVPIELELRGINSKVTIPRILDLELTPMRNPVTGEDELATLLKPTGFTSYEQELCSTSSQKLSTDGLSYDYSGKYGEFGPFDYTNK